MGQSLRCSGSLATQPGRPGTLPGLLNCRSRLLPLFLRLRAVAVLDECDAVAGLTEKDLAHVGPHEHDAPAMGLLQILIEGGIGHDLGVEAAALIVDTYFHRGINRASWAIAGIMLQVRQFKAVRRGMRRVALNWPC